MSSIQIEIAAVKKKYRAADDFALRGVNLTIEAGEFFGLLGPNGCGKTTLLSIMTQLLTATAGSIRINGVDVQQNFPQIKPILGLIPQEIALYPSLTVIENLTYFGRLYGLRGHKLKHRVAEMIEIARLENFQRRLIEKCSGGVKRRTNIVIALVHQPQILLLDEPTVNVDPQSRQVIFNLLKQLNQQGMTMIYTTHYLEEAEQLCDRVAIMDDGRIIAVDRPAALIGQSANAKDLGAVFLELTGHHLRD